MRWILVLWIVQCISFAYALSPYEDLMSKAVAAYADNEPTKAEIYLKQALELEPNDISATKILQDLRIDMLHSWIDKAQTAFSQEQWQDALQAYQKAKSLNIPHKDFSKQISLVLLYIEAERRLNKYVADIEVLLDANTRENANNTLKQIKKFDLSSAIINKNIKKLKQMLSQLNQSYTIDITSDGKSEIIIYKVTSLGMFTKKLIELMPGRYIAVARCLGYREFHHQFKVLPDRDNGFYIHCEERM